MKNIFVGLFFASLLLGSFYLGYKFSIDIFELMCFRTDLKM
jgi:hypothetical protein